MHSFTVTYTIKYKISFAKHYVFNEHKQCFNLRTGRFIKRVLVGGSIGYIIDGKFKSLVFLRKNLEKPEKQVLPF